MNVRAVSTPVVRFGGKTRAANLVHQLLGPVDTYVEPFVGSCAVPLRSLFHYKKVVINDIDSLLVNFWRSVQHAPTEVAYWADYPTSHDDLVARREWLRHVWPDVTNAIRLDPFYCNPMVAGWWVWAVSNSIDLLCFDWPTEGERHQSVRTILAAINIAEEVIAEAGETYKASMPVTHQDCGGQGVQQQREGVRHDNGKYQSSIPVVLGGLGGQGITAQRQGEPWIGHSPANDAAIFDGRRPQIKEHPAEVGVQAQRLGEQWAGYSNANTAIDDNRFDERRPRMSPQISGGGGVTASRKQARPDNNKIDGSIPKIHNGPAGQGVASTRQDARNDGGTVGMYNASRPNIAQGPAGQWVTVQRETSSGPDVQASMPCVNDGPGGRGVQTNSTVVSVKHLDGVEEVSQAIDARRPQIRSEPAAGRGVQTNRGGEEASSGLITSRPTVSPHAAGGLGVNVQRVNDNSGGMGIGAHRGNAVINTSRPHIGNDPGKSQGMAAQRDNARQEASDSQAINTDRPVVSNVHSGLGVNAQRTNARTDGHPLGCHYGQWPEYSDLPSDVLIDQSGEPFTGQRLYPWLNDLCTRMWQWIIVNLPWEKVCNSRAMLSLRRGGASKTGIFLDPPYDAGKEERSRLYSVDSLSVAGQVREWALTPDSKRFDGYAPWYHPRLRIVIAGFAGDWAENDLPDARSYEWHRGAGMENTGTRTKDKERRELVWASPHCLEIQDGKQKDAQMSMF